MDSTMVTETETTLEQQKEQPGKSLWQRLKEKLPRKKAAEESAFQEEDACDVLKEDTERALSQIAADMERAASAFEEMAQETESETALEQESPEDTGEDNEEESVEPEEIGQEPSVPEETEPESTEEPISVKSQEESEQPKAAEIEEEKEETLEQPGPENISEPEDVPEKTEENEPESSAESPEEIQEKYTLTTWWADNRWRSFAVFITGILLVMTLAICSDLLLTVSVYRNGTELPLLTKISIEHDLDALLEEAGVVMTEGDGYRWSGYGEDHNASLVYCPAFDFTISSKMDGNKTVRMNSLEDKSAGELLEEYGYALGELDFADSDLAFIPVEDTTITVHRVEVKEYESTKTIPFETEEIKTSLFYRKKDRVLQTRSGKDGEARIRVNERYVDGEQVDYQEEVLETITEPINAVVKSYGERVPVSDMEGPPVVDGKPEGWNLILTGRATGYSAGRTYRRVKGASGMWLTYGYVAVNPHQIPYGTKLYIESKDGNFVYGYCIAADTGIALMEGIIAVDLFYDTYEESAINAVWDVNIYAEP